MVKVRVVLGTFAPFRKVSGATSWKLLQWILLMLFIRTTMRLTITCWVSISNVVQVTKVHALQYKYPTSKRGAPTNSHLPAPLSIAPLLTDNFNNTDRQQSILKVPFHIYMCQLSVMLLLTVTFTTTHCRDF